VAAKLRSDEGDDLDRIGLLGWLAGTMLYLDREGDEMSAYRFPEGAGRLCERMRETIKGEIHLGRVLERVHQDGDGIALTFAEGEPVRVDRVVVTLPPRPLERVVFDPALGVGKRCAVEACGMGRSVKIAWHFDRAWWKDDGWGGSMLCDGPLQQTWDASMGDEAVLCAYINGDEAARWSALGDPVAAGLYELSQLFPQAKEHFVQGWFHDWVNDPWSRGGFSHLAPGYVLEHLQHIAPPESRVHFAGEHASRWVGFIEGALESAERVVEEIERL
jgi:monoamine oxidase